MESTSRLVKKPFSVSKMHKMKVVNMRRVGEYPEEFDSIKYTD